MTSDKPTGPAAADAAGAEGGERSWLCENERDRERMLDMEDRLRPVRTVTMAALAVAFTVCGPWLGWWTLAPLAVAAGCFVAADRVGRQMRKPEYAILAAWVASQLAIGCGVALTGGPSSPALALLAIPVVSLSARFSLGGVVAGVAITLTIMAAATVPVDFQAVRDSPPETILAAVLVVCVGALSTALMRSDLKHRSDAVLDQLTGMLNRVALVSRVAELEQQSKLIDQEVSVIVADIDHFKLVNDEHGHARGDAVLVAVAYLLRKELRAFDLAYRIGGEEFLILLPGADIDRAAEVAEQMRAAIAAGALAGGFRITMSFGVAGSLPGEAFDYESVFARADRALLDAKTDGRDRVRSARDHKPARVATMA